MRRSTIWRTLVVTPSPSRSLSDCAPLWSSQCVGRQYLLIADASKQPLIIIMDSRHCRLKRSWCIYSFFPWLAIRVWFYGQVHDKEYMTNVMQGALGGEDKGEKETRNIRTYRSPVLYLRCTELGWSAQARREPSNSKRDGEVNTPGKKIYALRTLSRNWD